VSDRPLTRKYARIERERRFLVESLPAELEDASFQRLRDCFVKGTHLRLRRVESPSGELIVVKLGQKIPDPEAPGDPRRRQMTTIYLPGDEARALPLEGPRAVKRRYHLLEQGRTFCVDVWEAPASVAGLILAEVECPSDEELDAIQLPSWAAREVTEDAAYSSIELVNRRG
jgi:hypothetical protein